MLRFDYSPDEIITTTKTVLSEWKEAVDRDLTDSSELFIDVMERNVNRASRTLGPMLFLQHVATDPKVRTASRDAQQLFSQFDTEMWQRMDHFKRCQQEWDTRGKRSRNGSLSSDYLLLLERYLRNYKHHGAHLSQVDRDSLKNLINKHTELELEFDKNCSEEVTKMMLTRSELDGMDENYLSGTSADGNIHTITNAYPDVIPILEHCNIAETRKKVKHMYVTRAPQNIPILLRLNEIRQHIADLLGYENRAAFVLEDKMLNTQSEVRDMLSFVSNRLMDATKEYTTLLEKMKGSPLEDHDYLYYHNKNLKTNYDLDMQTLKDYFPLDHVLQQMLTIFATMMGLTFSERPSELASVSNETSSYEVRDQHGELMGVFYLDLFPREGKHTHAMECSILQGRASSLANPVHGTGNIHVAALVCNFTTPTADVPTLLTYDEVETLFHEFGHVIHDICSGHSQKYHSLASLSSIETDFVEAPSQLIEQWLWSISVLKRISKHYLSNDMLPDHLLQRLLSTRYVGKARDVQRQVSLAIVDQNLPTCFTVDEMKREYASTIRHYLGHHCGDGDAIATWTHQGGGYSLLYYSYTWSLIVAADLFSVFLESGDVLNPVLGRRYRQMILSKGSSSSAKSMTRSFLGRDVSTDAVMLYCGV